MYGLKPDRGNNNLGGGGLLCLPSGEGSADTACCSAHTNGKGVPLLVLQLVNNGFKKFPYLSNSSKESSTPCCFPGFSVSSFNVE